ncbi:MAG: hypothetical protein QM533_09615 [Cytophagales bacterium]|nr:hypothetical protein [Cytophagales bacterium]
MALTKQATVALTKFLARADAGMLGKDTIYKAVVLTAAQKVKITDFLRTLWQDNKYICPEILDLKPRHGYESRVLKDGFSSAQYAEWLAFGCSDVAEVSIDERKRPRLHGTLMLDFSGQNYHLLVPIRSDIKGVVYVDDVIPKGLSAGSRKDNSPLGGSL